MGARRARLLLALAAPAALSTALLLLACLGCRSPLPKGTLPIDELEAGMKPETVRSLVGDSEAGVPPTGVGGQPPIGTAEPWVYTDEVIYGQLLLVSVPLAPALLMAAPLIAIADAIGGTRTPPLWIGKRTTTLYFEDERLARWSSTVEADPAWEGDPSSDPFPGWNSGFNNGPFWPNPSWQQPVDRRRRGRRGC